MNPFLLILGPSGVGKSTIIRRLLRENSQIKYVTPITDRPPRKGEHFKISVTPEEFTHYEKSDKFIAVNHYFTFRYGTPKDTVQEILSKNQIPILDMILSGVPKFQEYKDILFTIYLKPPSLLELKKRLQKEKRDPTGQRYREGAREISALEQIQYRHSDIHKIVLNDDPEAAYQKVKDIIDQRIKKS